MPSDEKSVRIETLDDFDRELARDGGEAGKPGPRKRSCSLMTPQLPPRSTYAATLKRPAIRSLILRADHSTLYSESICGSWYRTPLIRM